MLAYEATSNCIRNDLNDSFLFIVWGTKTVFEDYEVAPSFNCIRVCFPNGATKVSRNREQDVPTFGRRKTAI